MATKTEAKPTENKGQTVTAGGVVLEGSVVSGVDHGLTVKQQGQKARGELDENLKPIDKSKEVKGSTGPSNAKNAARTDKEKAEDEQIEEKRKVSEQLGGTVSGVKVVKVKEKLYQGPISATAVAATTGEEVGYKWEQAQPTTEEGLKDVLIAAYGSGIIRDSIKIDPENKVDPTKRTYLERP